MAQQRCNPQEQEPVEHRDPIHEQKGDQRPVNGKSRHYIAQKVNGADIIAEIQKIGTFFTGQLMILIQFSYDPRSHWKTTQKSHNDGVGTVAGGAVQEMQKRMQQPYKGFRKIHADHDP